MAVININDFPKYEKEIAAVKNDKHELWRVLGKYTGPGTGIEWDDETLKLSVVPGWHVAENGDVVKD